eukprot:SAG31_NODE_401_length_16206_cov_10.920780_9_plen_189_part_00
MAAPEPCAPDMAPQECQVRVEMHCSHSNSLRTAQTVAHHKHPLSVACRMEPAAAALCHLAGRYHSTALTKTTAVICPRRPRSAGTLACWDTCKPRQRGLRQGRPSQCNWRTATKLMTRASVRRPSSSPLALAVIQSRPASSSTWSSRSMSSRSSSCKSSVRTSIGTSISAAVPVPAPAVAFPVPQTPP